MKLDTSTPCHKALAMAAATMHLGAVTGPNDGVPLHIYDLLFFLWSWYSLMANPGIFLIGAADFVLLL